MSWFFSISLEAYSMRPLIICVGLKLKVSAFFSSLSFFFFFFFSFQAGKIRKMFSLSIKKTVWKNWRSGQPPGLYFIPWLGASLALLSLASCSVGIYSKALLNIFPFSECLFSITCPASLFGLCWRVCVSNVAGNRGPRALPHGYSFLLKLKSGYV